MASPPHRSVLVISVTCPQRVHDRPTGKLRVTEVLYTLCVSAMSLGAVVAAFTMLAYGFVMFRMLVIPSRASEVCHDDRRVGRGVVRTFRKCPHRFAT